MYNVTAIGVLLIDFTQSGKSANGVPLFEQNPGGAPANVLAAVARLGKRTSIIGKVGNNQFGCFLKSILNEANINTSGLVFSKDTNTTLAFVHLDENGERSFSFYRNPGADMMLTKEEIKFELIDQTKILHFGSISLTHEILV
ncbi:PfkB family carbohydrate kinase [Bacillus kwashiorkori]|uniref:PfkB family carbohydrate kinase n=1 Tax=Bacillus kwashiorkori TaxID=1522318 RepID=UPI0007846AEB|nr:PfkB family carbohydrate kinase [Bacillus kwashiorkori]